MKLHIGCGTNLIHGYVNCDINEPFDHRLDLRSVPWGFSAFGRIENGSVDEILAMHVLEHLPEPDGTWDEIRRILKPGGSIKGQVPYHKSKMAYSHYQHFRFYNEDTFFHIARLKNFDLISAKLSTRPSEPGVCLGLRLRNLIPEVARKPLDYLLDNMFDLVDFELRKPING